MFAQFLLKLYKIIYFFNSVRNSIRLCFPTPFVNNPPKNNRRTQIIVISLVKLTRLSAPPDCINKPDLRRQLNGVKRYMNCI